MNPIEISVGFEKFGAGSMSLGIKASETLYKSLSVAFGGYVPPANSDLDSVVLREALVGASWLEDAMHHQELSYENGVFKFVFTVHQEIEEELSPGDDLFGPRPSPGCRGRRSPSPSPRTISLLNCGVCVSPSALS